MNLLTAILASTSTGGGEAAHESLRTVYEFARLQSFTQWWQVPALVVACLAILAFVVIMYRRDSVELRPGVGVLLALLRLLAFAGILAAFLSLQERTERKVVRSSRVALLVDTSLSMREQDDEAAISSNVPSRIEQVVEALTAGNLIPELQQVHEVEVIRFDEDSQRLVLLNKGAGGEQPSLIEPTGPGQGDPDWRVQLKDQLDAQGGETQLGQAIRQTLLERRGIPLAGVVVLSDGGQNSGLSIGPAIDLAKSMKVPVFAIGLGSAQRPVSVRISDFRAPTRVYPGDGFPVNAVIEASGLSGREVTVQLAGRRAQDGASPDEGWEVRETKKVLLGDEPAQVKFDLPGISEEQQHVFRLTVEDVAEDRRADDNQQQVEVEVVTRQDHVLLFAGGPTREYQFLRNQLRRDKGIVVDVLLQTAASGISQDANKILDDFPTSMAELGEYDCIVAFDPDWTKLSDEQLNLLERWAAEMSGGLIVVAGPIHTPMLAQDNRLTKVRALYPVEFNKRFSVIDDAIDSSPTAWPLQFTREGVEADFLWLADTATSSQEAWSDFPGVYAYYEVRGPKPGATVYARYGDPDAGLSAEGPIYIAGQFYASGRVFFLGSGEMWRLRAVDEAYFEQFYTKLIRHVSQGRLLRGSRKDVLMVDDRYVLGANVVVRAQLTDDQHEPLTVPEVPLEVWSPSNDQTIVRMRPDPAREGLYVGQFATSADGAYRIELKPMSASAQTLTKRIQVRVPDLERENPQRNDALLSELAQSTDGDYYIGLRQIYGDSSKQALAARLPDRTETSYLLDSPNPEFDRWWMGLLMGVICGSLCVEWLLRRLSRLA